MLTAFLCVAALCVVGPVASLKLPSYIGQCYRNDPKLNECALKVSSDLLGKIIDGDPKYKIPKIEPLSVVKIQVDPSGGLAITMSDVKLHGLSRAIFKAVRLDPRKQTIEVDVVVPDFRILGLYEVDGKILVVPIKGNGNINVTIIEAKVGLHTDYDLVKQADGLEYVVPKPAKITFDVSKAYFQLDNLFNGDKALGAATNQLLNDNWKDVLKDVGPAVAEALAVVFNTILTGICNLVPYNEILPAKK